MPARAVFHTRFYGDLAGFAGALRPAPPGPLAWPLARLQEAPCRDRLWQRFAADLGCGEARANASQWSKYLFSRLLISTLVVQLGENRVLAATPQTIGVHWRAGATPECFFVDARCLRAGDAADLAIVSDALITPLIEAFSAHSGLAPRVFWSNAGVYVDWALGVLERQGRLPAARLARARRLFEARRRPDGEANRFHRTYKPCRPGSTDGNGAPSLRCRRLCCMRDLDPSLGLCANCPRAIQAPPAAVEHTA